MPRTAVTALMPLRRALRTLGVLSCLRCIRMLPLVVLYAYHRLRYLAARPATVAQHALGRPFRVAAVSGHVYAMLRLPREKRVGRFLQSHVRPGDVVWDIGAHVGLYTIPLALAAGREGRVVAFEPSPLSRERLEANVALNNLSQVEIVPLALGSAEDRVRFQTHTEHGAVGRIDYEAAAGGAEATDGEATWVEVARGDAWRAQHGTAVPAVVKLDVEGFEDEVIEGMRDTLADPACRAVVAEVHFGILASRGHADAPRAMAARLRELGFDRVTWLDYGHLAAGRT